MYKRVTLFAVGIFLVITIVFTGCADTYNEYISSQYDTDAIKVAVKQSAMPDNGFRFATAEYKNNKSAYATFYITSAEKIIRQRDEKTSINQEELLDLLEVTLSAPTLDLTDIYCAISLINDKNSISTSQKEIIENYLQSLYLAEVGCYSMPNIKNNAKDELYIYPTFLVNEIASFLDIKLEPVEEYLQNISKRIFDANAFNREDSSTYSLLLQLLQKYKINIPTSYADAIISMFENDLDSIDSLTNMEDIYFPVYFLDYKEICYVFKYDNPHYNQIIIASLCDGGGAKSGIIYPYDSYGLYAFIHTLELANYEFETHTMFDSLFCDFDAFLLGNGIYIMPGETTSNFVDTYYADSIINYLNIDVENELSIYCSSNQEEIIESGTVNAYYFLKLLQRNDLINTTITNKEYLIDQFAMVLDQLLTESVIEQQSLPTINAAIKSIRILEGNYDIDDNTIEKIISNYTYHSNQQQTVYDLCELIDFLCIICPNEHELLYQYCVELETQLIKLMNSSYSNKLMLFYRSFSLFEKSDYKVSTTLINATSKLLFYSQSDYGLYKGGDSSEDIESFRNTYYGVVLTDIINQF